MKRNLSNSLCRAALCGLIVTFTSASLLSATEAPDHIRIKKLSYQGSGCPANSADIYISEDALVMTVIFDEYLLDTSVLPHQQRRAHTDCHLKVQLEVDKGWSFGIVGVDYRGFAILDEGVTGVQSVRYQFPGIGNDSKFATMELQGPFAEDYLHHTELPLEGMRWAGCKSKNKTLHIKSRVELVREPHMQGLMTVDTIDGELSQEYALVWRRCQK